EQVYVFQKVCSRNPLSRTDVCVGGRWSRVYDVHEYIFLIRRSNVLVAVYYKTFGRKVWVPNEGYAPIRSLLRLAVEKAANPVRAENIGMPVPIE
ncbi:MAG: hypothetical protein KDE09_21220, partial [Anaerolineales bacterium]|nr:hypothetical protein [Anaerolineales bacterium]